MNNTSYTPVPHSIYHIVLLVLLPLTLHAQLFTSSPILPIPVLEAGRILPTPAAGGLDAPQYSQGDLDGDGLDELLAFDRASAQATVFSRQSGAWVINADLSAMLPRLRNWALLRDYNQDGRADIFTDNIGSVSLYRNEAGLLAGPSFNLLYPELISTSLSGGPLAIYVLTTDVPGIADIDGDGDLDIVTFESFGVTVDAHFNQSRQNGGGFDPVSFRKQACYGRFSESQSTCDQYFLNINCRAGAEEPEPPRTATPNHVGSTLCVLDANADGAPDLLIGDVICRNLNLLLNSAAPGPAAMMASASNTYPAVGQRAGFDLFPAAFLADVSGSARPDLLAAPNIYAPGLSEMPHLRASSWLFEDEATSGAPDFRFQTQRFLQQDMVDEYSGATPAWLDIDLDGDQDLVIGSQYRLGGTILEAGLTLYRRDASGLSRADTNLAALARRGLEYAQPYTADLNADQRQDLLLLLPRTFNQAWLIWYKALAAPGPSGYAFDFSRGDTLALSLLPGDALAFADLDGDQDQDLVLGREQGNLAYLLNEGTPQAPAFFNGGIQSGYLGFRAGNGPAGLRPAVADFDQDGTLDLLLTSYTDPTRLYRRPLFLPGYTSPYDTLLLGSDAYSRNLPLPFGRGQSPLAADINGDTWPDLLLGTGSGGLLYYPNRAGRPLAAKAVAAQPQARLLSNPSQDLKLYLPKPGSVRILSAEGRVVADLGRLPTGSHTYSLGLPKGLYLIDAGPMGRMRWVRD